MKSNVVADDTGVNHRHARGQPGPGGVSDVEGTRRVGRRAGSGGTPGRYAPIETRRALLDSATALFERNGFAETSVQVIVDHAGLTKGAFYHHFDSKEEVLRQIHHEYIDFQVDAVGRLVAETDDPVDQLRGLVALSVRSVDTYRSHVAVFLQERRYLADERFASVKTRRDEVEDLFVDVIRRGVESGSFQSDIDPRVIAFGIIGMSAWVYQWYTDGGRLSLDDVSEMFWNMVYRGICNPER